MQSCGFITALYTNVSLHLPSPLMHVLVVITGGAAGASLAESGGPGMTYLEGTSPVYKNLRIDNKCQKPKVT